MCLKRHLLVMRDKFIKFMYGRYGIDELGKHTLIFAIAVSVLGMIFNLFSLDVASFVCSLLSMTCVAICFFRALSKNINRRVMENHKYLGKTEKIRGKIKFLQTRFRERKTYKYVKCPQCKNYSRVPRGKGKIKITCRVCKRQFDKKV